MELTEITISFVLISILTCDAAIRFNGNLKMQAMIGSNVGLEWIYDSPNSVFTIDWNFKNTSGNTLAILTTTSTGPAVVLNNFNIVHNDKGSVTLTNVQLNNSGTYTCTVTYTAASGLVPETEAATLSVEVGCSCSCKSCSHCLGLDISSLALSVLMVIITYYLCRREIKRCAGRNLGGLDKLVITINCIVYCYGIGVSVFGIIEDWKVGAHCNCRCNCKSCLGISIADIVVLIIGFVIMVNYIYIIKTGRFYHNLNKVVCCVITFAICIGIYKACKEDEENNREDNQGKPKHQNEGVKDGASGQEMIGQQNKTSL